MVNALRASLVALVIAGAGLSASMDQTYGKGVSVDKATPIAALYESPEKFVGKTIRIDGVVTSVCEAMGCWMALGVEAPSGPGSKEAADAPDMTVRFKVEHEGSIVFPLSARGKKASAEGVFERIEAAGALVERTGVNADVHEAAKEHATAAHAAVNRGAHEAAPAHHDAEAFGKIYQVKVTGAIVR